MYCSKCAAEIPDDANFCYKCANPVTADFNSQNFPAEQAQSISRSQSKIEKPQNNISAVATMLVVLFLIGLGFGGLFAYQKYQEEQNKNYSNWNYSASDTTAPVSNSSYKQRETQQIQEQIPTALYSPSAMILKQTFHVDALSYSSFTINIQGPSTHLTGTFSAQGGKNDIRCIVVDDDEFVNFQNNTDYRQFFDSRYVSRGKIDIRLAEGVYHIIFTNQAALLTSKTVTAEFYTQ